MAKRITYLMLLLAVVACGGNSQPDAQQGMSPDSAEAKGHEAAWIVAHTDHADTIALQRAILDVRAQHDQFVLMGQDDAASDFEQAFIDSLRRVDPSLAREIFGE